jgi:hypothetical protein
MRTAVVEMSLNHFIYHIKEVDDIDAVIKHFVN